jgi:DNA-binding transcriptional LysR family regulator
MPDTLAKLPPLDLLRGFVAVARRMSFTQGAADLFITQSAVSRQVRQLEEWLGVSLVIRRHRAIALTEDGQRLFRVADACLQQLGEICASLRRQEEKRPVTVTASLGVTSLWLVPRLGLFQAAHPGIDVRVAANNRLLNLEQENIDLAIRYCPRSVAPPGAVHLFGETLVPVAHPRLKVSNLEGRGVLEKQVLLELDDAQRPWLQWADWLHAGKLRPRPKAILRFNQYDQVIQAAIAGQGIALGRFPLIQGLLQEGRLAIACKRSSQLEDYGYWLVRAAEQPRAEVEKFGAWILQQAELPGRA